MEAVDSDSEKRMSNKRKSSEIPDADASAKCPRRRRRSRSEPRNTGSDSATRREALRLLISRYCLGEGICFDTCDENYTENEEINDPAYIEDPLLLDAVPECMDPELLGFLLCAQETLRFLRQTGMSFRHTVYVSLRNRFVRAIKDLGIA